MRTRREQFAYDDQNIIRGELGASIFAASYAFWRHGSLICFAGAEERTPTLSLMKDVMEECRREVRNMDRRGAEKTYKDEGSLSTLHV